MKVPTGFTPWRMVAPLLVVALAACSSDGVNSPQLSAAANAMVNADVAAVTADGVGEDVELMRGPGGQFAIGLSADRGRFECDQVARPGLTVTRTCVYKDAAGNTQAAYDSLTTASVQVNATVKGDVTRGPMSMTVDRTRELVVTGLAGRETTATWNGTGRGAMTRVRTSESGETRQYEMTYTVRRTNVVIPVPRTATSWPLSGTVTKSYTVKFTGGPNDGKTVTREVVVTFNGTATPVATINGESWELDLSDRGKRRRP
ncbi:MAG: hypothetical protein JNJ98_20180 [Gemmatimonadetes bacterium]|nr:hypothetical protein [Gemmatimonadota bacterium]